LKLLVAKIRKNILLEKYYLVLPEELGELLIAMLEKEQREE